MDFFTAGRMNGRSAILFVPNSSACAYLTVPLPDLMPANKELADTIKEVHGAAAFALIGLVALHVAAVIKHQVIDKDGLLDRMRPQR